MSKRIRLSDEAYERLVAHKNPGETFSDVVLRLAGERSLLDLAGILNNREADALEDAIVARRNRRQGELDSIATRLSER